MSKSPEQLLIEAYKQLDDLRNKLEEIINLLGQQKMESVEPYPVEVKELVDVAIHLTPEQREHLKLFLHSIKQS